MNETTAGRIIFGPENVEPLLGVTALESVGMTIDPANRTLKRLPAIPLKRSAITRQVPVLIILPTRRLSGCRRRRTPCRLL